MVSQYKALIEKQRAHWSSGATHPLAARLKALETLQELLQENSDAINAALFQDLRRDPETNVELPMSLGVVMDAITNLEEWAKTKEIEAQPPNDPEEDTVLVVKEPYGVVLVISPWNFPLYTSIPLASALAAGNTVILKPSEISVNFSATMAKLIPKYFDEKLVAVVEGGVEETTNLLKERFDYICYTGCPPVGRVVMAAAAKHLTPVTLELGGKSPVLVEPDADFADAAQKILKGKILNCGQICLAPDYILTTRAVKAKLIAGFQAVFNALGDLQKNPAYGRIISNRHFQRLSELNSRTRGRLVVKSQGKTDQKDLFLPIHVYDVDNDDVLLQEEIFGPILPIVEVANFDTAVRYVKAHEKPLGAYLFTKNQDKVRRFIKETSSGGVTVNDVMMHGFAAGVPFGGVGTSGMGRLLGEYGFNTFTHEKAVLMRNKVGLNFKL